MEREEDRGAQAASAEAELAAEESRAQSGQTTNTPSDGEALALHEI